MLPPQDESALTLINVAFAPPLTMLPPLAAKAVPLGERRSPTIWLLPLSWRVAPGPIARFCAFVPLPCAPCQRVFSPPARVTVPPLMVKV